MPSWTGKKDNMISIVLLCVFFAFMIGIGLWGMKRTTSLNDFFLGGRSIGPWVSALAYGTTYFSAVLFIGFAGKLGWGYGLDALWIAAGNAVLGALGAWLVLGRRTRRMTQNLDVMTMPEFLHERYGGRTMKMFTAMIIFVFLLPYSASVFKGLGYLFEVNFNISFDTALLIMIGITGIYLILGGYFAIAVTDFVQGLIMIVGSLVMVGMLVGDGGGIGASLASLTERYARHVPPDKTPSMLMLAALVFMTSFGTWGLPQMVQKFYAIKDESLIVKAALATMLFAAIIGFAAYFTGAMSHVFYDAPPMIAGKPDFERLIPDLLKSRLPEFLMALILLLVLSASMSTLSSLVLVAASTVAIDLYKGHVNPRVSSNRSVFMIRFLSGVFIVFSYVIARHDFDIIITLMSLSWGAVAGTFMAPYVYGLYWKRATKAGVRAGMITGLGLAVGLFYALGPANSPIAASVAIIVPFIVVPLVSLATRPPAPAIVKKAFRGLD